MFDGEPPILSSDMIVSINPDEETGAIVPYKGPDFLDYSNDQYDDEDTNNKYYEDDYDSSNVDDEAIVDPNNLPISVSSCYILNKAYQKSLEDFRDDLEQKLLENRAMQEELMYSEPSSSEHIYPNSLLKFMAPYFRDAKGLRPDDNEDTKSRKLRGIVNLFYIRAKKPWKDCDKENLYKAIEACALKKNIEPLTRRKNLLLQEIENLEKIGTNPEELNSKQMELQTITKEIEANSQMNFIPTREESSSNIDWLEVSRKSTTIYTPFECEIKWINELHPSINHGPWLEEEDKKLVSLVSSSKADWDLIAQTLNTNRTAWQCCHHYQLNFNESLLRSGPFTKNEFNLLKKLINKLRIGDYIPWHQVAYFMDKRSLVQIKNLWEKMTCPIRRSKWSELEDKVLMVAVDKFGTNRWKKVAHFIPGRTNRQCRERYIMRIGIKDRKLANWTLKEDWSLIKIAPGKNFRWVEMMDHILGRNSRQIAARYDILEKKLTADVLRSSKDLQELVPRKKANKRLKLQTRDINLSEDQSIDEFLRQSKKQLEENLRTDYKSGELKPKINRLGVGGRKKKARKDEEIEQELVRRFSLHSLVGKVNQSAKLIARPEQESKLLDCLKTILCDYFSGKTPQEPHLLAKVVSSVLKKQVIGANLDNIIDCPPIFPPDIVSTSSYQCLLHMKEELINQLEDKNIDTSQFYWDSQYRMIQKFLLSVYYWPCILSNQTPIVKQPPQDQQPSSSSTLPKSTPSTSSAGRPNKRRKKSQSQVIYHVNEAREKQRFLFTSYDKYFKSSVTDSDSSNNETEDKPKK